MTQEGADPVPPAVRRPVAGAALRSGRALRIAGPQTQERLTRQVADFLVEHLGARGAGVGMDAEHACMTQRGARAISARTVTSAMLGTLRHDATSRAEFLALAGVPS